MTSIKSKLLNELTIQEHINLQNTNYAEYISNLLLLLYEYNVEFTILKLAKILVAALTRLDKELAAFLLKDSRYELPVILKACDILDSKRLYVQLSNKTPKIKDKKKLAKHKSVLANLEALNEGISIVKPKVLSPEEIHDELKDVDSLLNDLSQEKIEFSLTKAKIKFLKKHWVQEIDKNRLEFMALLYPIKHWKTLINLFHLKPTDFPIDWFSTYIFTKEAPKNSIIDICTTITPENIKEVLSQYKLPYDFLRLKYKDFLTPEIMSLILDYTNLAEIIRHWPSFNSVDNEQKVLSRIKNGEELGMPYGELLKRIRMFIEEKKDGDPIVVELMNIADKKLLKYKTSVEEPVIILGDASGSMEVAVKTSSIITSILVKICRAKLHLFRDKDDPILNPPTSVKEVLAVMEKFKAHSSTAPAASLYPYYERKEVVKTFILVTDEEENTGYDGQYKSGYNYEDLSDEGLFTHTFKKYREEVYPAKLVFISFLKSNKDGPMVAQLKKSIPGIEKDLVQFIMSNKNPDLRKLDDMLNTLSLDTDYYDEKCSRVTKVVELTDKQKLFNKVFILDMLQDDSSLGLIEPDTIRICI